MSNRRRRAIDSDGDDNDINDFSNESDSDNEGKAVINVDHTENVANILQAPTHEDNSSGGRLKSQGKRKGIQNSGKNQGDKRNPSAVPRGGQFFLHDNRQQLSQEDGNQVKEAVRRRTVKQSDSKDGENSDWKHDKFEALTIQERPIGGLKKSHQNRGVKKGNQETAENIADKSSVSEKNEISTGESIAGLPEVQSKEGNNQNRRRNKKDFNRLASKAPAYENGDSHDAQVTDKETKVVEINKSKTSREINKNKFEKSNKDTMKKKNISNQKEVSAETATQSAVKSAELDRGSGKVSRKESRHDQNSAHQSRNVQSSGPNFQGVRLSYSAPQSVSTSELKLKATAKEFTPMSPSNLSTHSKYQFDRGGNALHGNQSPQYVGRPNWGGGIYSNPRSTLVSQDIDGYPSEHTRHYGIPYESDASLSGGMVTADSAAIYANGQYGDPIVYPYDGASEVKGVIGNGYYADNYMGTTDYSGTVLNGTVMYGDASAVRGQDGAVWFPTNPVQSNEARTIKNGTHYFQTSAVYYPSQNAPDLNSH